ncbi:hypothetical protein [Bacillus vallismortis]|uniref:Uncharacterized protein n=1 Tax=Bacillus vallismortis TaxID=72361 RepID=A0AAP3CMZ3_BACVA|nr:hypothetical protein [Bacillus vallismortis]MCY7919161.1 hypothetical protein [Bacillus vallismortis]MCY8318527.1 hypothetical protein [Bacillus vallismortis]
MNSIGIRVTPKELFYTIVKPDTQEAQLQKLTMSLALDNDIPRQLSLIRTTLLSIITEYNVSYAGIKTAEGNAKSYNVFRINVEGVVQELFADSSVVRYFAGTINSLSSRLNVPVKTLSSYLKGENALDLTFWNREWDTISKKEHKESLIAALAAIPHFGGKADV